MTSRGTSRTADARRRSIGPRFRLVWLSVVISSTGDGMFVTALPLLAATLTGDPVLIAGITVATRLPWLVLSMFTGAIADRMDRRRLMIVADGARFVVVALLGGSILAGTADIWQLYAGAFLLGAGETLHVNAAQAVLPDLVASHDLMQANARFGSAQIASAQFAGPPLGATLFNAARSLPFLADAVSFAVSAVLIRALPDAHAVAPPTTTLREDLREGVRFVRENTIVRRITGVLAVINFFYFAATSLLVLYNTEQLGGSTLTYAALFVGAATGTVVSRFMVDGLVRRVGPTDTMVCAIWLWAASIVGLAIASTPWVAVGMHVLLGMGTGLWWALNTTIRQQVTPARLLGRMNSVYRTISWGVVPFGAAFGGVMARLLGLRAPFVIGGVALVVVAACARSVLQPVRAAVG
jgi:MFS family permease